MNALLDKAFAAISRLPETEQEAIAREMLDRLEADARWDQLLADEKSKSLLAKLAAETRTDIECGDIVDDDPSSKTAS